MVMELRRNRWPQTAKHPGRRRRAAGFSLIEALIAAAIILIIAIGLIPLFTRAMVNNTAGSDSTFVSTAGQSGIETAFSVPFDNPSMVLAGTATTTTPVVTAFRQGRTDQLGEFAGGWGGTSGATLWTRTTTVRQYDVTSSLSDGILSISDAKDGTTAASFVHLKEIEVQLTSGRGVGLLTGKTLTLRYFRAE